MMTCGRRKSSATTQMPSAVRAPRRKRPAWEEEIKETFGSGFFTGVRVVEL